MPPVEAPTRELGTSGGGSSFAGGWLEQWEETAELRWPQSVITFDTMRRRGKVAAVRRAWNLPLRRAFRRARLVGDDVPEPTMRLVEAELGLGAFRDGRRRRRRQGIDFEQFIREALLYLDFGHMVFEQHAEAGPPPPGIPGLPATVAHLRKLAPRPPRTIVKWHVAQDGNLDGITQLVPDDSVGSLGYREQPIPITQLVVFVNEREGADWTGTSLLRAAYPHWLVMDVLMRLGPIIVERNGLGYPTVTAPTGGDVAKANELASRVRAGEDAGLGLEAGYVFDLVGVKGTLKDELPLMKWHGEELAKTCLAMLLDLGHDNGARSLGDTFADTFHLALDAVADTVAGVITEHVIRDLVEWTFGPDHPYPILEPASLVDEPALSADQLGALATAGLVVPDQPLEDWLRERHGMPERAEVEGATPAPASARPLTAADLEAGTITVDEHRQRLGYGPHPDATVGAMPLSAYRAMTAGAAGAGVNLAALSDDQLTARIAELRSRGLALPAGAPAG